MALLVPGLAYGAAPTADLSVQIVPANADIVLPTPPSGKHWVNTFDDEFPGTSLDRSKWNLGYATDLWCAGCPQSTFGISVTPGLLSQTVDAVNTQRSALNTNQLFSQRFGYFVFRGKMPTNYTGEGNGLWPSWWSLPVGKAGFPGGCQEGNEESDIMEYYPQIPQGTITQVQWNLHDYCLNQVNFMYPTNPSADLSASFHDYGMLWEDDGSPHGSLSIYFDGVQQHAPVTLDSRSMMWDNGIYLLTQVIPNANHSSPNDSLQLKFVRAYQAVNN